MPSAKKQVPQKKQTSFSKRNEVNPSAENPMASAFSGCESAGLFRRLAATVYDFLILVAIWILVGFLFFGAILGGKPPENALQLQLGLFPLLVTATLGFYSWFWRHGGQTLGMRAWKLKVVHARMDGTPITLTQCALRCLTGIFSWGVFGLGYLWVYADPSKDTWHDRLSGTRTLVIPKSMM